MATVLVLIVVLVSVPTATSQVKKFPESPFKFEVGESLGSLQIEYTISGAELDPPTDVETSRPNIRKSYARYQNGTPTGNELKISAKVTANGVFNPKVYAHLNTGGSESKDFEDMAYSPVVGGFYQPIDWERSFELSMPYDTVSGHDRFGWFYITFSGALDGLLFLEIKISESKEPEGPDSLQIAIERTWLDRDNAIVFVEGSVASKSEVVYKVFYRTDPEPKQGYIALSSDGTSFGAQCEFELFETNTFEIVMENKGKMRDIWVLSFDGDGTLRSSKRQDTSSGDGVTPPGVLIRWNDPLQVTLIATGLVALVTLGIISGLAASVVAIVWGGGRRALSLAVKFWSNLPGGWKAKLWLLWTLSPFDDLLYSGVIGRIMKWLVGNRKGHQYPPPSPYNPWSDKHNPPRWEYRKKRRWLQD